MIGKGKGKRATLILAMLKDKDKKRAEESSKDESNDVDPGLESAMDDFISAVKKGDSASAAEALCTFIDLHEDSCMGDKDEDEDDKDDEEY